MLLTYDFDGEFLNQKFSTKAMSMFTIWEISHRVNNPLYGSTIQY